MLTKINIDEIEKKESFAYTTFRIHYSATGRFLWLLPYKKEGCLVLVFNIMDFLIDAYKAENGDRVYNSWWWKDQDMKQIAIVALDKAFENGLVEHNFVHF